MPPALDDGIPAAVRRPLVADGVLSRLMDTFTGGAFLAGLGLWAGADSLQLGILAALPFLAQAAQVPALTLLLRLRDRRRLVVLVAGLARLLLLVLAAILVVAPSALTPGRLLAILAVNAVLAVVATAAWNWWMRDLLPPAALGRIFGRRNQRTVVVATGALLAAGWLLDAATRSGQARLGYAILFTAGGLCGLAGIAVLHVTPHVEPPPSPPAARSLRLLRDALRRPETRTVLAVLGCCGAAVSVSLPFVAVYLLRDLGARYAIVAALAVVSQVGWLAGLRGWGHLSDRHGDRGPLAIGLALLCACLLGWVLTGSQATWPLLAWLAALHFATGFALGGIDLGGTNLLLRSAPAHHAQAHLAAIGLGRALLAGVATVGAGALWQVLGSQPLLTVAWAPLPGWSLHGFQLLSLLALGAALLALAGVLRLREERPTPVLDVARTMRREVQMMSSVAGVRVFLHGLSYSVELFARPFAARGSAAPPPVTPGGPRPSEATSAPGGAAAGPPPPPAP